MPRDALVIFTFFKAYILYYLQNVIKEADAFVVSLYLVRKILIQSLCIGNIILPQRLAMTAFINIKDK